MRNVIMNTTGLLPASIAFAKANDEGSTVIPAPAPEAPSEEAPANDETNEDPFAGFIVVNEAPSRNTDENRYGWDKFPSPRVRVVDGKPVTDMAARIYNITDFGVKSVDSIRGNLKKWTDKQEKNGIEVKFATNDVKVNKVTVGLKVTRIK